MSITRLTVLPLLLVAACQEPAESARAEDSGETVTPRDTSVLKEKKVLLVFQDGFIPDALPDAPTLQGWRDSGAWSLTARAESTTISGTGWSSFLTGVHWDKHGVSSNDFSTSRYTEYPSLIARIEEAVPEIVTASCVTWLEIQDGLMTPAAPDHVAFADYYQYSDDYFDDASCDQICADAAVGFAAGDADLIVVMFGELDGVGHLDFNGHYAAEDPLYREMVALTDQRIAGIVDAIRARPTWDQEDWLFLFSSDHAGSQWLGHGSNIPEHREVPFLMSGPSVVPGEIWPPPQTVDVAATVMAHLGVSPVPAWDLDGVPVGFSTTAPPVAALGANLIFNGDAEYERGFLGYDDVPDASVAGWYDPDNLTVVRYDSPNGLPATGDPLPDDPGENFFAGGTDGDTQMTWTVDLAPLSAAIAAGARFDLSAWLGGYADQDDASTLKVSFLDRDGGSVGDAALGPVLAAERGHVTGFVRKSTTGAVPQGSVTAVVRLVADVATGSNDAYADNLSLVLQAE